LVWFGWNGLTEVSERIEKSDDVNRLVKFIYQARLDEKNFISRGDETYVNELHHTVDELMTQANETKEKFLAVKKAVMNIYQAARLNPPDSQGSFAARCKSLAAIGGNQISNHLLFNSTTFKIAKLRLPKERKLIALCF
jgi:hypothetical protein